MSNPDVFSYLDYREYCRDFYQHRKSTEAKFSYRSFARDAGVAAAHLKHVIDGKRNLSPEMSIRFGLGMKLHERELEYFENLVRFNQASNLDEKSYFFEKLRKRRSRSLKSLSLADAASLLSDWHVVAIKHFVVSLNTIEVARIQRVLRRKLSESVIQRSIDHLLEMGWLFQEQGVWKSKASQICFPDEVRSYVVRRYHRQMLELAQEALEDDIEKREFGGTVFKFPRSKVSEMKKKLKELQEEFISYVQATANQPDQKDESVYFFGVQCFSLQNSEGVKDHGV